MAAQSIIQNTAYEEFEPFCKWQRKEDRDVLEIHLQDFKKEHLMVLINKHGVLKIFGERPIDASKSKGVRFYKEVAAPSAKYDSHSIHAKFVNCNLIITLPKPKPGPSEPGPSRIEPRLGGNASAELVQLQMMQLLQKRPTAGSGMKWVKIAVRLAEVVAMLAAYWHYIYKSTSNDPVVKALQIFLMTWLLQITCWGLSILYS